MKNLNKMTKSQLSDEYFMQHGIFPDDAPKDFIIAALYYGKRIQYVTAEVSRFYLSVESNPCILLVYSYIL